MLEVLECCDAGGLGERADIERPAHPVQHVDHVRRRVQPAQAQRGEPEQLGEGAGHDHVAGTLHQLLTARVVVAADVLGIGGIDHQQHVVGQAGMQAQKLLARQIAAGRVVGIGDEDRARPAGDARQHGVDVGPEVALGCCDRGRTDRERAEPVHQEAVRAVEHLVAGPGIGAHQQLDQLVGAGAADHALGIEVEAGADRLAQRPGTAVRVTVHDRDRRAQGRDRPGARPERRLVGRELDDIRHALDLGLAADVGLDLQNAGARPQRCHGFSFSRSNG